jgi:ubiquinone/menaquinone biosynthesis C-methylase UbiE
MPDPSEPDPSEPRPASPTGPNRPGAAAPSAAGYVFADPAHRVAQNYHRRLLELLAETLDPFSCRRLEQAGAGPDARCLEIGAGTGSIAHWLANRLAPAGQVIATDLDPSLIAPHQRITTLPHDISRDQLPGRFDLIHARLVLAHLPDRHHILGKLSEALNPGGALIIEEFDPGWDRCLLHTPDPDAYRLFHAYHHALTAVLRHAGADPGWARRTHQAMHQVGLINIDTELWSRAWHGGQPGCLLPHTAATQLAGQLTTTGQMVPDDLDRLRALLLDPRLIITGNTAISTTGHRAP